MTDTTKKLSLDELKALMAGFSASELKAALKAVDTSKPTLLSLTMDAILSAGLAGPVITDAIAKTVTAKARECGVLTADESATQSSVSALIRYVAAYDAALTRAGYEIAKTPTVASDTTEGVTSPASDDKAPDVVADLPTGNSAPAAPAEPTKDGKRLPAMPTQRAA